MAEQKTPSKKSKWFFCLIVIVVVIFLFLGLRSLRSIEMTKGKWQLYWQTAEVEKRVYGEFAAKIEKITPNYIRIVFPGAEGKMEGKSRDGWFYEGIWNDPETRKKPPQKMNGKWHLQFVNQKLALGWAFNENETEKRIIHFQRK